MGGRVSVFRGKDNGVRIQGVLTKEGGKAFERQRENLARLYTRVVGHAPTSISDADVVEFLARGEGETRRYLVEQQA